MKHYRMAMQALSLVLALVVFSTALPAFAAPAEEPCTRFSDLIAKVDDATAPGATVSAGMLTEIVTYIKGVVDPSTKKLFEAFTKNATYTAVVSAAAALSVIIFGIAFMIGVVQPSFAEAFKRLFKIGLIFTVASPAGWEFFSDTVVAFFNKGTDEIIAKVMSIGMQVDYLTTDSPFLAFDAIAGMMASPDMIIGILGTLGSGGPYGLMMGGLLGFALTGFLKMILEGLKTYAISYIARALLLGVAPIFIIFLLFEKTKQLFMGWVNTLVQFSLQPILYFTFISFFLVMIMSAAGDMLRGNELCWTPKEIGDGTQNKVFTWAFKKEGEGYAKSEKLTWQGFASCVMSGNGTCSEFPINVVDVLTFMILVFVAGKFAEVVDNIAREISNSMVNLDHAGKMNLKESMNIGDKAPTNNQASAASTPLASTRRP